MNDITHPLRQMKTKGFYGTIAWVTCLLLLWYLTAPVSYGQKTLAAAIMKEYQSHKVPTGLLQQADGMEAEKMVDAFLHYSHDSLPEVRRVAYQMIQRLATRHDDPKLHREVIKQWIEGLNDRDAGISSSLIEYLTAFNPSDFDPESRYKLSQRAKEKKAGQDKIILLTGYLHIDELLYNYRLMFNDKEKTDKRLRPYIQLAMARMNDSTAVRSIVEKVRRFPVNDDMVYDFYPLLVYTCQKPVYDFLFSVILSDKKDCLSSNPDKEKPIICAYRVIALMAPYLKDFPVSLDETGEAIIDNYPQTLAEVRQWIENHKDGYEIVTNKY